MEEHCKENFAEIREDIKGLTVGLNRVNEVVFNGYGSMITAILKQVDTINTKLDQALEGQHQNRVRINWVIGVASGLAFAIGIAVTVFVGG